MNRDDYKALLLISWALAAGLFMWGIIFARFAIVGQEKGLW